MGYSSRFSRLPLEGGGAQRRRLASLFFAFGQPPALRASPFHGKGGRWVTHPASPSFLWKEMARSVGSWLRSLFAFGQPPALRASPFQGKGIDGLLIPLLPPSFGRRWRVAPEVGFALFRLRPTPALRASPFHGKGVDGLLIPLLPPSSGRRRRVAPEVGFALFRFQPTPCPSGIPLPWEGGRWTTRP